MSVYAAVTVFFCAATLAGCVYLYRRSPRDLAKSAPVKLGVVTLSAVAAYKLAALFTIVVFPTAAAVSAHTELLEGAKETSACGACHVMTPMVTDLHDPDSDSLSARHFKNGYIAKQECYTCHSGYGFNGAIEAKLEGYRHLVRYTTGLFEEPIKKRGHFDQSSCLNCHSGKANFMAINSHRVAAEQLANNEMSCQNCHGPAHPTRSERTPGSAKYDYLMGLADQPTQQTSAIGVVR